MGQPGPEELLSIQNSRTLLSSSRLIPLGHISGPHGIKGEVLIKTYTEQPENIVCYGPLSDERGEGSISLELIRVTSKGVIARVEGVQDRNGAEALKGRKLCVPRDRLPEPEEDEWYYSDLVGLSVLAPDGTKIGKLVAMHDFGAGDVMELQLKGRKTTDLVAFNKTTVPGIDLASGTVTVVLPAMDGSEENAAKAPDNKPDRNSSS